MVNTYIKNKFAERIKGLRLENNLTQKELGEKLGYKKNSVCNWEARGKEPSFDVLLQIAILFKVSTDYLLGLEND